MMIETNKNILIGHESWFSVHELIIEECSQGHPTSHCVMMKLTCNTTRVDTQLKGLLTLDEAADGRNETAAESGELGGVAR